MAYLERYPVGEPVTWRAHGRSNHRYESDSYGRTYYSNAIVLHVSMCCEQCVLKVRKSLENVYDIDSVDVDVRRQRVTVMGDVDPDRVLRKVQRQISSATFWDSSYDYASFSSATYEDNRPTVSLNNYKYYGRRPSDDYEDNSAGAYDYRQPILIIEDYDYYSPSPAYEYSESYPSSPTYSRQNNYTYSYPSHFEYSRHTDYHPRRSYDAYRYR